MIFASFVPAHNIFRVYFRSNLKIYYLKKIFGKYNQNNILTLIKIYLKTVLWSMSTFGIDA